MPLEMNCINAHGAALRILHRVEVEGVEEVEGGSHCLMSLSIVTVITFIMFIQVSFHTVQV